ncbi:biotin/lipoyl-binding protein [Humisphaera borealis]|uniref:Biotin/lipoyl-binding protein n=1 Tax=Humisphaera borealis TaxID=2807512 RepID=A0A7M2WQS0_9BACT|nr:biotin/lipoyl-binding protein [Humisphaera borealis]QOV87816.1 biotin/lipoyl-binding protein [Humisphaera borealis]
MTLQLRPTFSESWYRVKTLKVKLRPGAQISRQYFRGERWYVVRDPAGNQFHRLSDPAYRFVGLLDGTRSVEEAWDLCGGTMADDAPTQPEVIQILSHLYSANLIDADVTPDATVLLRRHKNLNKRKFQGRLMNIMFPRIPLWDLDTFLVRWMPLVRQMFSRFGAFVWLAVVIAACVMVASKSQQSTHNLTEAAKHAIDVNGNTINLLYMWGMFVFVKLIHELGHAFACRRFGGECHELGIMFLVFIPTPYVDASTAWSFPNKWHRVFVGAAGMIVELFFASLCAFIWVNIGDPNHNIIGQLAFNAMLVASVTTIIFNANPLLRYDGYYILSDYLEIPNLRQKSQEYSLGLIKRHIFRVKQQQPLPPPVQRFWLLMYYCTSGIYRIFVGIMIILLVAFQIPILGILMALGGVVTWIAMPVFKIFKYLTIEPELHRKRGRATAFVLAVASIIVVSVGVLKFDLNLYATGIAEPANREVVRPGTSGFVARVVAKDGQWVKAGDVILEMRSDELQARKKVAEAQLAATVAMYDAAVAGSAAEVRQVAEKIGVFRKQIADLNVRIDKLVVKAGSDGRLTAPNMHEMVGQFLPQGQEFAMIMQTEQLVVHTALEQKDAEPILANKNVQTQLRFASDIKIVLVGGAPRDAGAASAELRHPGFGQGVGGEVPVDPTEPGKSALPLYDVAIPLVNPIDPANPEGRYVPYQRVHVRFTLDKKPLAWQWVRRFYQLIQENAAGSKWL